MDEQTQEIKEEKRFSFFKTYGWLIPAVCGVIAILFLFGTIIKLVPDDEATDLVLIEINLTNYFKYKYSYDWTMIATIVLLSAGVVFSLLQKIKKGMASAGAMAFILAFTLAILSREFYANNAIDARYAVKFGWGISCSGAMAIIASVTALSVDFSNNPMVTRQIAEDGVLIAAAFILNLIKIPLAAGAGSVNFQMLPLFIIALRHGPAHGLMCGGVLYGLITCLTDGYGFACYPFDYLIGFGGVMVLGYFRKFILGENQTWYNLKGEIFLFVGALLATLIRFIGSTASSMIIYKYSFAASAAYNAVYIPVSGLIAVAVLMAAYGPLAKIHHMYPVNKSIE